MESMRRIFTCILTALPISIRLRSTESKLNRRMSYLSFSIHLVLSI
jgi:hypothetical protein